MSADHGSSPWPQSRLDPIARLRAIEAGVPGMVGVEGLVDAPFDAVWSWISDLAASVPQFDRAVTRIQVRERRGPDLDLRAWSPGLPIGLPFHVRLEEGYCLMRSTARLYLVGMAAAPEGDRTRFRHAEAVPLPGIGRAMRPFVRREVAADLRGIVAHFA